MAFKIHEKAILSFSSPWSYDDHYQEGIKPSCSIRSERSYSHQNIQVSFLCVRMKNATKFPTMFKSLKIQSLKKRRGKKTLTQPLFNMGKFPYNWISPDLAQQDPKKKKLKKKNLNPRSVCLVQRQKTDLQVCLPSLAPYFTKICAQCSQTHMYKKGKKSTKRHKLKKGERPWFEMYK